MPKAPTLAYTVGDLSALADGEAIISELTAIPGIGYWRRNVVTAPRNAAWLAERILADHHVRILRIQVPPRPRVITDTDIKAVPELREGILDTLTPYQWEGPKRFGLGDGMLWWGCGSGKTRAALIWALLHYGKILFVTRASARGTIKRETETVTTVHPTVLLHGVDPIPDSARIVIVSWEALPLHLAKLMTWEPHSIVWDEAHMGKGWKRWDATPVADGTAGSVEGDTGRVLFAPAKNRGGAAMQLARLAHRRLALTGSPLCDRLRDLWGQLDLIAPGGFGGFRAFAVRYCDGHPGQYGGLDSRGRSNETELHTRIRFVHEVSLSVSCAALPPKRRLVTYIPPDQQVAATGFAKELVAAAKRGPTFLTETRLAEACCRKRRVVIERICEALESGLKVVVFTARRKDCDRLALELAKKVKSGAALLLTAHGGMTPEQRDGIEASYMAERGACCLVATWASMGESRDLQDTDLGLVSMLPQTPKELIQLEGRFCRHGQKRPVLIEYLIAAGTFDERVASLLIEKLPAVEKMVSDTSLKGMDRELGGTVDQAKVVDELLAAVLRYSPKGNSDE
jgi:hypothetical protein